MADPHDRRILVDLDGTLTVGGGHGPYDFAPVATGAKEFLAALKEMFDEVVICTARADLGAVKNFARQNGWAKYINDYTNTKLPAKMIVEDRAVVHEGDLRKTLDRVKSFRAHWEKGEKAKSPTVGPTQHSLASTQFNITEPLRSKILALAAQVPEEILAGDGREGNPHITVLYGITEDSPDSVREAVAGFGKVQARLGSTSLFHVPEKGFDVLKIEVTSPDLHRLRKLFEDAVEYETDFPDYQPHATIAYVSPGKADKLKGIRTLSGESMTFDRLVFSSKDGQTEEISLAK